MEAEVRRLRWEGEKERNGCINELGLAVDNWGFYPSGDPLRKLQNAPEMCPR